MSLFFSGVCKSIIHIYCGSYACKCFDRGVSIAVLNLADVSLIYAGKLRKLFLGEVISIAAGNEHFGKLIFGSKGSAKKLCKINRPQKNDFVLRAAGLSPIL